MVQTKTHSTEATINLLRNYMKEKVKDYGDRDDVQVLTDVLDRLKKQENHIKILSRLV